MDNMDVDMDLEQIELKITKMKKAIARKQNKLMKWEQMIRKRKLSSNVMVQAQKDNGSLLKESLKTTNHAVALLKTSECVKTTISSTPTTVWVNPGALQNEKENATSITNNLKPDKCEPEKIIIKLQLGKDFHAAHDISDKIEDVRSSDLGRTTENTREGNNEQSPNDGGAATALRRSSRLSRSSYIYQSDDFVTSKHQAKKSKTTALSANAESFALHSLFYDLSTFAISHPPTDFTLPDNEFGELKHKLHCAETVLTDSLLGDRTMFGQTAMNATVDKCLINRTPTEFNEHAQRNDVLLSRNCSDDKAPIVDIPAFVAETEEFDACSEHSDLVVNSTQTKESQIISETPLDCLENNGLQNIHNETLHSPHFEKCRFDGPIRFVFYGEIREEGLRLQPVLVTCDKSVIAVWVQTFEDWILIKEFPVTLEENIQWLFNGFCTNDRIVITVIEDNVAEMSVWRYDCFPSGNRSRIEHLAENSYRKSSHTLSCKVKETLLLYARNLEDGPTILKQHNIYESENPNCHKFATVNATLHSLLAIKQLDDAVVGMSSSHTYIWNVSSGNLIKIIESPKTFCLHQCTFALAESGLLFFGIVLDSDKELKHVQMTVNPMTKRWLLLRRYDCNNMSTISSFRTTLHCGKLLIMLESSGCIKSWNQFNGKLVEHFADNSSASAICCAQVKLQNFLFVGHKQGKLTSHQLPTA